MWCMCMSCGEVVVVELVLVLFPYCFSHYYIFIFIFYFQHFFIFLFCICKQTSTMYILPQEASYTTQSYDKKYELNHNTTSPSAVSVLVRMSIFVNVCL